MFLSRTGTLERDLKRLHIQDLSPTFSSYRAVVFRYAPARTNTCLPALNGDHESNEFVVAARRGDVALMKTLLAAGADPNDTVSCSKVPDMDGATSLLWAARQGRLAAVDLLLAKNSYIEARTVVNWTPLYVAARNGHKECVDSLLRNGASVDSAKMIGDEFTNVKLDAFLKSFQSTEVSFPSDATPPKAQGALSPVTPTENVAPTARVQDNLASAAPVQVLHSTPLSVTNDESGMSELDELRLRIKWGAPPTSEEETAAALERRTVFR